MSTLAERQRITEALRSLVPEKDDWLFSNNVAMTDSKCIGGIKIDGGRCADLLEKCMSGDITGCAAEWNSIDFSNQIDMSNIDTADARNLLTKMNINVNENNAVENWLKRNPTLKLDDKVTHFLKLLVAKVGNPQATPIETSRAAISLSPIPLRVGFTFMEGGNMVGGGSNVSAKYIQMTNYLKEELQMVGGSSVVNTSKYLRVAYTDLVNALQNNGKKVDDQDNSRILELIDNLERTESKGEKALKYILALRKLINNPSFNKSEITGPVTADMMEQLETKHKQLVASAAKKSTNIISILNAVHAALPQLQKEVADIGARLAKAGIA